MIPKLILRTGCQVLALLMFTASSTFAQGSIAGAVQDTTGAVMPGVTVEASSPALLSTNQIWRAFTTTSTSIESAVPGHNASHQFNSRLSMYSSSNQARCSPGG